METALNPRDCFVVSKYKKVPSASAFPFSSPELDGGRVEIPDLNGTLEFAYER